MLKILEQGTHAGRTYVVVEYHVLTKPHLCGYASISRDEHRQFKLGEEVFNEDTLEYDTHFYLGDIEVHGGVTALLWVRVIGQVLIVFMRVTKRIQKLQLIM
jgi:hypothetical protein